MLAHKYFKNKDSFYKEISCLGKNNQMIFLTGWWRHTICRIKYRKKWIFKLIFECVVHVWLIFFMKRWCHFSAEGQIFFCSYTSRSNHAKWTNKKKYWKVEAAFSMPIKHLSTIKELSPWWTHIPGAVILQIYCNYLENCSFNFHKTWYGHSWE